MDDLQMQGAGRLRGEGDNWGDGTSSSGRVASRGEWRRPINRAGYRASVYGSPPEDDPGRAMGGVIRTQAGWWEEDW